MSCLESFHINSILLNNLLSLIYRVGEPQTYLPGVSPQTALGGEPLSADIAVERSIFQSLDLGLVVPKVLLQV